MLPDFNELGVFQKLPADVQHQMALMWRAFERSRGPVVRFVIGHYFKKHVFADGSRCAVCVCPPHRNPEDWAQHHVDSYFLDLFAEQDDGMSSCFEQFPWEHAQWEYRNRRSFDVHKTVSGWTTF